MLNAGAPVPTSAPARDEAWPAPWLPSDAVVIAGTLATMFLIQWWVGRLDPSLEHDRGLRGLAFSVFPTVVTAVGLAVRARSRGVTAADLGLVRPRSWRPVLVAWLVAIFAGPLVTLGSSLLAATGVTHGTQFGDPPEAMLSLVVGRVDVVKLTIAAATLALLVPLLEELIFRGLLHRVLRARWALLPAALLSGAVFAAVHLDPATLLPLFVVGFVFAWSYERSGSLWGAIVPHGGLNALTLLVALTRT